ncbi:unnamed protein product [Rhizophagus irregularis]|nr:unnamed protein product [Rhizophagus irregularis]
MLIIFIIILPLPMSSSLDSDSILESPLVDPNYEDDSSLRDQIYELMESSSFNQFLVEAGNIELRMSSESESCQEDSDHSSVSGGGKSTSNNNTKSNKHLRRFSGLKLKEKYRKLLKTTTHTSTKVETVSYYKKSFYYIIILFLYIYYFI